MSVSINYKNSNTKSENTNEILFVDEKFKITNLKKQLKSSEYSFINDLLKSKNLNKKIIKFDLSSKKKIILISLKKNIKTSGIENLGANFFEFIKDLKQKDFHINSDFSPTQHENVIGYFLHGLKLKSYLFDKYKKFYDAKWVNKELRIV